MSRRVQWPMVVLVALAASLAWQRSASGGWGGGTAGSVSAANASYYVCAVKDTDGNVSFEAVRTSEVDKRMEQLKKDYVEAYRAWMVAQKEAKSAGQGFDDPKPSKPVLKKLGNKIQGQQKAQSVASLYQEKYEAKQRDKEDKDLDKIEDGTADKDVKKT